MRSHARERFHWLPDVELDTTAYLSAWLVLLFGLSAHQVFAPLGALGSPALLVLVLAPLLWAVASLIPNWELDYSPQPVRTVLLGYTTYLLCSFVVASVRPLSELERTASLRALIITLALTGLALLVADGIRQPDRLVTLLRRAVYGAGFMSLIGALQFFIGEPLQLQVPGLTWNQEYFGIEQRSLFDRPAGTTMHPIEFSVVTASMLPLAVHMSLHTPQGTHRQLVVASTFLIALGVPLSLSRSGFLALTVALAVMLVGWSWRRRVNAVLVIMASIPLLWGVIPGLIGTIRALFTWFDEDPSVSERRARRPAIIALFRERPWLGLGNGTWSQDDYFLIDNEVYVTLLETGIVGLLLLTLLLVAAFVGGIWVSHQPYSTEETAHLGRSLAAGLAGMTASFFTFDAFHYRILAGVLFLYVGAIMALLRLTRKQHAPTRVASERPQAGASSRPNA